MSDVVGIETEKFNYISMALQVDVITTQNVECQA